MHCAAIEFRIETGMRMGEALALKRGDIDAKRYRMLARVTMYTDNHDIVSVGDYVREWLLTVKKKEVKVATYSRLEVSARATTDLKLPT